MLAKRLAPSVSISGLLAGTASARVPEVLAPTAAVPPAVSALTREVLGVMVQGKLMKTAAVVLLLACAGFGVVSQAGPKSDGPKDAPVRPAPPEAPVNPPNADNVVWGKEVDGLQLGLVAASRTPRLGETMRLEVRLRNVGKVEVKVTHGLLRECAPQVSTADGTRVSVFMPLPLDFYAAPTHRVLKPGETITLYKPELAVESEDRARMDGEMRVEAPTICVAAGKYKIVYGRLVQSHPALATGPVEFEVKDPVVWGQEVDGLQAGIVAPGPVRMGRRPGSPSGCGTSGRPRSPSRRGRCGTIRPGSSTRTERRCGPRGRRSRRSRSSPRSTP
jgi:hypothetical protein